MYHPYKQGYSVLPRLEKLEEKPFYKDKYYHNYIVEKYKAIWSRETEFKHDCSNEILTTVMSFIKDNAHWVDTEENDLSRIMVGLQEDIAIHRIKDGKDWLAYANICFPSSWNPEEKIGKPLAEIHAPIPGMNLAASYKMAEASTKKGPFRRFVWSPIFENKINFHPDLPKKKFDKDNPYVKVKVEKQITWPFPELNCFLFILRQYIVDPMLTDLAKACVDMNEDQRKYKDVDDNFLTFCKGILK